MEANTELVEKLVDKTGVSYTEAKAVLEKTDWDILEALIQLEAEGKISSTNTADYSTKGRQGEYKESCGFNEHRQQKEHREKKNCKTGENFKSTGKNFGDTLRDIFDKGNTNYIEMYRNDERKLGVPVTVFILLLIIGFWIVVPLMIVGLFCGCRFAFSGNELGKDSVNSAIGKANDFAEDIKKEIRNEIKREREEHGN